MKGSSRAVWIVQDSITPASSIGKLALWAIETARCDGWEVTALCRQLDPAVGGDVKHMPLVVPPRSHLVQYAAGRTMARMRLRTAANAVVFTYLPQLAARADLWHAEFLETAAAQASPLPDYKPAMARLRRGSQSGVSLLEDRYLRQVGDQTEVLWCSELLEQEFGRLYGAPPRSRILHNPALAPIGAATSSQRAAARARFGLDDASLVAVYLGGLDERKGCRRVLAAAEDDRRVRVLFAGPASERLPSAARAGGAVLPLGHLSNLDDVLDAADALVMPSLFEPFGLVAVEAAAHGVPVIVSSMAGVTPLVLEHHAGMVWNSQPLSSLLQYARDNREQLSAGGHELARAISGERQGRILLDALAEAHERRQTKNDSPGGAR